MWGGFAWGAAAWASQPEYGSSQPGLVYGGDFTDFVVYGNDGSTGNVVSGEVTVSGFAVYGGDTSSGEGIVFGGDQAPGSVHGGDERA